MQSHNYSYSNYTRCYYHTSKEINGILHESDSSITIAATNIKAKPIEDAIPDHLSLRIRINIEDIENGSINTPANHGYCNLTMWSC